jgi:hypothetical protein
MKRRTLLGGTIAAAVIGLTSAAIAQQPPIKIGMSMPQTGGLAGGGKASLLGIEVWRDDVNAKGGLLGRKVELVVYDDKSSAAETPALYAKLLDVDKVDILFAPYATVPTAPLHLARTRDVIRDLIRTAGAKRLADRCGYSVDDAVAMALADLAAKAPCEDRSAVPPGGVSAGAS